MTTAAGNELVRVEINEHQIDALVLLASVMQVYRPETNATGTLLAAACAILHEVGATEAQAVESFRAMFADTGGFESPLSQLLHYSTSIDPDDWDGIAALLHTLSGRAERLLNKKAQAGKRARKLPGLP